MDSDPWAAWLDPAALFRAGAALTPVGLLETLIRAAGRRLRGRRVTAPGSGGELSLVLESLSLDPDPTALALGQLGDLRLAATDVRWRDLNFHRMVLVCSSVHVRPVPAPVAVAAPVTLELGVRPEVLRRRLTATHPRLGLALGVPQRVRLWWTRYPSWAALTVSTEVSGSTLLVRPREMGVRSRMIPLPDWAPVRRIELPDLPRGLRLREVTTGSDEIVLHLVADEWREQVPARRLESLLARLT